MISLGSRDGRKGLEQGFSSNKREMDETELEEGEACSYQDDDDTSIDPDIALSYIDEKLQNVLGHFKKDFEGVVSAESLGAKFGIYGSFLPAHRRSPVNTHSRTPPRVQNHVTPQSPNTVQAEGGHQNPLVPANVLYTVRQGSASAGSASSFAYKPLPPNDICRMNANTKSIQSLEECTPRSEVRDHKTLKVRIKVGSENLSVKKNAAIYSGLGLDGSPTSSLDDSPMESEGLSCKLSFDGFESPTRILQMMTSPLFGGCFLSPLSDDLMCLSERRKHLQNIPMQPSPMVKMENSVKGQTSVKDNKTIPVVNSRNLLDKKGLLLQDKRGGKDSFRSPFHLKETDIDAVSYEELVSNALKLPLLSNAPNDLRGSPKASLKERVSGDVSKREPFETAFFHVSSSEKSHEKAILAGKAIHHKAAEARKDMMTDSEKVGDGKSETADSATNNNISSKIRKSSKIGLKDPVNCRTSTSTAHDNGIVLPCGKEHFSSGDEKRPKKSQEHGFSTRKITVETDKDNSQVLKDRKYTDAESIPCGNEMQKESNRARGQYADFFGEMNELEGDILDSPNAPAGEMLKPSEVGDKTTLGCENTIRERTSSLETRKGSTSKEKLRGSSNIPSVQEKGQPMPEPASVAAIEDDNWVQCDKCQKWRLFPPGSKVDNLPDKWDCSLMTWLPGRNRCSLSEEETNNFHAPPLGMTSANNLSSDVIINGKATGKVRKSSKSSFQDSPNRLPSSVKKKQQSVKGKNLKEAKESCLMNELNLQQQPKFSDIYLETGQEKEIEKHRTDCYSDGGHAKIANIKSRRKPDQELPRTSKKIKTQSKQSGDTDRTAAHNQGIEVLGVNSGFGFGGGTAGNDCVSNSEFFASQNPKDGMMDLPPGFLGDSKFQVEALPSVGSVPADKSSSGNKKRKSDSFKDPPSSTPSLGKLMDVNDKSNRKRHRVSKSEGKESSLSKRNGKVDKKSKNVSHHRLDSNGCLQKDLSFVNPVVAATSSSSKISGSLKVKCKFQEIKGSPVESVSSSPFRIPNSDKLTSGCIVIGNDNVQVAIKLETSSPRRCSTADDEGSGGQYGAIRKDIFSTAAFHGSPNYDMQDKSKGGLNMINGNSCIDDVNLDKGYFSEAQASHRCVDEKIRGEVHLDANLSNSGKSCKNSPLSKDKNQISKSNSERGKIKKSASYDNSLDFTSVYEEKETDRKTKIDEKYGSNADKTENCALFRSKESSFPNPEGKPENNERRSSKKCDVEKSEDLVPVSAKEKSRHITCSDGERDEISNIMQPCQGSKASTSTSDARPDGLPREPRRNLKADNNNGNHIPSNHPISNGHRIKNQDAPSPLRRDSSSQAASSAIKEATSLKHLADRLKSSGSTESTGMYFDAALKFLHGASLLESGKTENIKHADIVQSKQIYSSTAKLCQFCAHEFEKSKDMASAALAYKCVEVAFMRVIYSAHNTASRDRHELQTALQMIPPGESPSSSASDIDNLNNTTNGEKTTQARSSSSPQLAANLVIAARNRPNFSRLLSFAQDVNSAMEASRKSRIAFASASDSMGQANLKDGINSIKRALDFNFHDVDGLLRLVRLAKEAISR